MPEIAGRLADDMSSGCQRPLATVVCLSYQRRDYVLELLSALHRQDYPAIEVIVVDNNSSDGTVSAVESLFPQTRIIRCPQNFGMVAYNLGLVNAKGKYIFVIDDDGLPVSDTWITDAVGRFEANPHLGALACTIRMADTGKIAYDSPQFSPDDQHQGGYCAAAFNGTGAGLRADAVHAVGYYPFHFFRSWLELSLCTKLIDAGWEVRYFPELEVWHWRPTGSVNRPLTYYGLRNYFWYVWTFYPDGNVLRETMRYFAYCLKLILRRQLSVGLFARSWCSACLGWARIVGTRQPVSPSTIIYLRHIRQHTNDYGLVPAYRRFSLTPEPQHIDATETE
jgi:GT2 family glycosyltransferase